MQLENSFQVSAPPDKVFAYLLDINKVVGCVPGAELTEVVDESTFKGKVKVKVGPITVAYSGTARIAERDESERMATLSAEGRETTGPGSARASAQMRVQTAGENSLVTITTEYHVAGRVAQFGRGVMEDVSRRPIQEMATCIQAMGAEGLRDHHPLARHLACTKMAQIQDGTNEAQSLVIARRLLA